MTAEVSEQSPAAEAHTTTGRIQGRWENGLAVFRGIPFAAPPVGDARFAAPRRVPRWDGVREAFAFGTCAPQDYAVFRDQGGPLPAQSTGTDWLTLNVWTPAPDRAALRPVMVWIHGGAYKLGSSNDSAYDPQQIVREGELVVVSCNYRLGVEGFAAIGGAPANRGLLDQVAALEWVRENIAEFGGDPDQVTVFGESAGAGSVAALLAMPSAARLFHRAVAQSFGGPFLSPELAADVSAVIAARRGLRPTATDLSTVEPVDLAMAGEEATVGQRERVDRWGQLADHPSLFGPVVDGDVLPTTPWQALAAGAGRGIELIAGHTRDEYRLFLPPRPGAIDAQEVSRAFAVQGPVPDAEAAYRAAFPNASAEQLWVLVRSDWLFRMPSLRLAESQALGGGQAYLYELTWPAPSAVTPFGACHGLDLPLLFGDFTTGFGQMLGTPTPAEALELSARFRTSWTAFAATGDPGWPAFAPEHRLTQVFGAPPTVAAYPEENARRLWQDYEFRALPLRA
ncbi:carboxylesterase/lipase family protein [Streptomyces sp. NPDC050528]|uniref:carboxylesterase/lipase family protein n=1 Tax=Streptomyces sp. NPDC050528 TaxID=3365623 RepID=UPI003795846A